jgi:hypothetical protein
MHIKDFNSFFKYIIVLTRSHSKDIYNLFGQINVEKYFIHYSNFMF